MKKGASQIIKEYLSEHDITKTKLAHLLNESVQNLSKKLKKTDLDTHYVAKISNVLDHNFFEDIAREYEQSKLQDDLNVTIQKADYKEDFIKLYIKMQEQIDYLILNAKKNELDKVLFKQSIEEIKEDKETVIQSLYKQNDELFNSLNEDKVSYKQPEKDKPAPKRTPKKK